MLGMAAIHTSQSRPTGSLRDNVKGRDINLGSNPLAGCRLN